MQAPWLAAGDSPGHCVDSTGYTYTVTPFSAEGMKQALEQMMLEAGVTLLYHTTVIGARVQAGRLKQIECFACGQRFEVSGPGIGVRSSRRMLGDYVLTAEDILQNRLFEDDIAVCGYPIDIHSSDGAETKSRFLRWGTFYGIPYRCLTNSAVPNLMAAGRNISCTFEAQASTASAPAARRWAIQNGCLPNEVDVQHLLETLKQQGGVYPIRGAAVHVCGACLTIPASRTP